MCGFLAIFNDQVAHFFTDVPSLLPVMRLYIICLSCISPIDGIFLTLSSLIKICDLLWIQMIVSTVNYIIINNGLVILGLWVWGWGPISVWIGFGTAILITFIGYMVMLFWWLDWTQIKELESEEYPTVSKPLLQRQQTYEEWDDSFNNYWDAKVTEESNRNTEKDAEYSIEMSIIARGLNESIDQAKQVARPDTEG